MIGSICLQLSEDANIDEIKKAGFDTYYVDHGTGIYPSSAAGVPFTASYLQSKGDPITDLYEDMAADGAIIQKQQLLYLPVKKRQQTYNSLPPYIYVMINVKDIYTPLNRALRSFHRRTSFQLYITTA